MVIYPSRSIEREQNHQFGSILALNQVQRIYLDELSGVINDSLGVGVVKLVVESENEAINRAKFLISQAKEEITEQKVQQDLIDLIETIIVYKLPQKTRKEIETMLGLSELKQTKVYQEALAEGEGIGEERGEQKTKLKAVSNMIRLGLSLEIIAQSLELTIDEVNILAKQTQKTD